MPIFRKHVIREYIAVLVLAQPALVLSASNSEIQPIGNFSASDMNGWKPEHFVGETHYRLTTHPTGVRSLCAESRRSASGLVREIQVDLTRTPFLNWSWYIENALLSHDEKTKQGDDYPARVYVVVDDGPFFWQTKALNYVWAGRASPGSLWVSPYISNNVRLIAVESGNIRKRTWQHEKRNVLHDLESAFGRSITRIDAVAIMTDTDDTGTRAEACYGDIFFSAD